MPRLCCPPRTVIAVLLALAGCTGGLVSKDGSGSDDPDVFVPEVGEPIPIAATEDAADRSPLRRLTNTQYQNVVRDLLGRDVPASVTLPPDNIIKGFDAAAFSQTATRPYSEAIVASADALSNAVDQTLAGCSANDSACPGEFVAAFGRQAMRRPLTNAERSDFESLFSQGDEANGFAEGVRAVVHKMLLSPDFLYRVEVGAASQGSGDRVPLTDYEVASRLAFFLWETTPDDALLDAAAAGRLSSASDIRAQVTRMFDDPRARAMVKRFHRQWLELDGLYAASPDEDRFGAVDRALFDDLIEETERFAEHVAFDSAVGTFEELMTAPYTFLNERLATHYGLAPTSDGFKTVDLDPATRGGILTQGASMARLSSSTRANPIYRGDFLLKQILCRELKLPESINVMLPEPAPDASFREKLDTYTSPEFCAGCHSRINPPGYALDTFDALGRYRSTDPDSMTLLDTAGEFLGVGDADGTFTDATELVALIAQSSDARACYADKWFLVAFGRGRKPNVDDATLSEILDRFESSGGRIKDLIHAITETEAFRTRFIDE